MRINKSTGTTSTEIQLANLCDNTFLKLWSYANPFKNDKKELCDLLAVFENHIFIFFVRENSQLENSNKPLEIQWNRWKKNVIDSQIRTLNGAERYITSGRSIYLDSELKIPFPIAIDIENSIIHKIIIAHGAENACINSSNNNIYGSLAVCYGNYFCAHDSPFVLDIDKSNPVHVFDSHNLPILFKELDTISDFTSYLDEKSNAIKELDCLMYCGEEDLLAFYFKNFDEENQCHFIAQQEKTDTGLFVEEGFWAQFITTEVYKRKKIADKISYFWDDLLQNTCQNALEGILPENSHIFNKKNAIIEMAKEPRFMRRALSKALIDTIKELNDSTSYPDKIMRKLSFRPSFYEDKGYVFLVIKAPQLEGLSEEKHIIIRENILEIACGAAKNNFPHLKKIIGISIDPPNYAYAKGETYIFFDCEEWNNEISDQYKKENEKFNFFTSKNNRISYEVIEEFPSETE